MREIILGFIQGVTEFLPISSSGHLAIVQNFYPGLDDSDILLDILLHLGTVLVVLIYYRRDIIMLLKAAACFPTRAQSQNRDQEALERKMLLLIVVGSIPTAMIGLLLQSIIEHSFASLPMVGIALLVTGMLLYVCDSRSSPKGRTEISYLDALVIGTVQGIAVLPGISRSGSTISVGILRGLDRKIAAKYSFLLSIPAILGAVVLQGKDLLILSQRPQLLPYILGMGIAFVTGYISITALIQVVVKKKLSWFSYYCWAIGGFAVIYGFLNVITI